MSMIKLPVCKLQKVQNKDIVTYLRQMNAIRLPLYLNIQATYDTIGFYEGWQEHKDGSLDIVFKEVDFSYPKTIFQELYEQFPEAFSCMPLGTFDGEDNNRVVNIVGFVVKTDMTKISEPLPPRPFP